MLAFELNVAGPVHLEMTGKFVAPSSDWIHLSRILQDYELIIMTEGVLYLAGDDTRYTLSKGSTCCSLPTPDNTAIKPPAAAFIGFILRRPADLPLQTVPAIQRIKRETRLLLRSAAL